MNFLSGCSPDAHGDWICGRALPQGPSADAPELHGPCELGGRTLTNPGPLYKETSLIGACEVRPLYNQECFNPNLDWACIVEPILSGTLHWNIALALALGTFDVIC